MMRSPEENVLVVTRTTNTANYTRNYKRYPPYGRQIQQLRLKGRVPAELVWIVFDWNIAKLSRRIIIPNDIPPNELEFGYLSGIPVQVAYHTKDSHRVISVVEEILKIQPSWLATLGRDLIDTGEATTIIKPLENIQIEEVL